MRGEAEDAWGVAEPADRSVSDLATATAGVVDAFPWGVADPERGVLSPERNMRFRLLAALSFGGVGCSVGTVAGFTDWGAGRDEVECRLLAGLSPPSGESSLSASSSCT